MTNGAIATSGNYEIYFDREKMFHHIVDPRTGLSPHDNASVSVTAPMAMEADALSTSIFVMEPHEGKRFMSGLAHRECLIITKENQTLRSSGWKGAAT
jgi:thiamine biosynthesis lipoprotein